MTSMAEQLVLESGLPLDAAGCLEPLVDALRDMVPSDLPTPSAALAALLASPPRPVTHRSRRRLMSLGGAVAAMSSLTLTGVAAAANELPEPAQRFVAQLSERYLPFQFPQPQAEGSEPEPDPEPVLPAPLGSGTTSRQIIPPEPTDSVPEHPTPATDSPATVGDTRPAEEPTEAPPTEAPTDPAPSVEPSLDPTDGATPSDAPSPTTDSEEPDGGPRVGESPTVEPEPSASPSSSPSPSDGSDTESGDAAPVVEGPPVR